MTSHKIQNLTPKGQDNVKEVKIIDGTEVHYEWYIFIEILFNFILKLTVNFT